MTREEIKAAILALFEERFEIEAPGLDEDLREVYEFDSIDAIELLRAIEVLLGTVLTRDEKKRAMDIRTLAHILDYVQDLADTRSGAGSRFETAAPGSTG